MTWSLVLGIVSGTIMYGAPLLYATLGEVVGQRAGMVNLGLEGILLVGASVGLAASVVTGSPWAGIAAAGIAGCLFNLVYAFLVVSRKANQLASGLALMFLGTGLSAMIGKAYIGRGITGLARYQVPGISSLPGITRTMFSYDLLVYLAAPVAVVVWWLIFRTRWGLGLRAVGESPSAAFAAGRRVSWAEYQAAMFCGLMSGIAGAHLSVALARTWTEGMTGGRGFIAVALVIFSKWHPLRAIVGALVFGGAVTVGLQLQASGSTISPFVLNMIPYVLTLGILLIWGGARRLVAPAALGRVYFGEE
ncbi:MAG: ABC transporter permease [Chloroflexi bacterium]|nr:ABC transporter permease [Chloroflexota bacterium]